MSRRWILFKPELAEWEWNFLTGKTHDQAHLLNHYDRRHLESEPGLVKILCVLCGAKVVLEQKPTTSRGYTTGGMKLLEEKCDPVAARERIQKQRFDAILMEAGESP